MDTQNKQIYQIKEVDSELQIEKDKKLANRYLIFSFLSLGLSVLSYILALTCSLSLLYANNSYLTSGHYNGPNSTAIIILHVIYVLVFLAQTILNVTVFIAFYLKGGKIYSKMHVAVIVTVISCLSAIYSILIYILTLS